MYAQSQTQIKIDQQKKAHKNESESLEKLEGLYATVRRVKAIAEERKVPGLRGLLGQFITCQDDSFLPCIDIVARAKLFSFVVDDL